MTGIGTDPTQSSRMLRGLMSPLMSTGSWRASQAAAAAGRPPRFRRRCRPRLAHSALSQPFPGTFAAGGDSRKAARAGASPSSVAGIDEEDSVPFTEYSASVNADYWATRPVTVVKRALRIGAAVAGWYLEGQLQRRRGSSSQMELSDQRADALRHMLTNLGPTFIKIGQAVSSRPDLVPPQYLRELEKLQDQIPPFSTEKALRVIREEYGVPASAVFADLSPEPLAAASLGQVYKATVRSDGRPVAVKVQRPGVAASIALDVFILRQLAVVVRHWRKLNTDLPLLLDGWAASLFTELDYRQEAANGIRFRELYGQMEDVFVPRMDLDMTTRKVLVMEWVDGERLRTAYTAAAAGASARGGGVGGSSDDLRLVEVGVRCSLEQMLEEGFYHADPHPGNLLRTADGRLAYLDFGMMGQIDSNIRRALIRATLHLVNREFSALADDFIELGLLPAGSNREEIVPALTSVFEEALKGGVSNVSFGELSGNLGRTMYQFKFQIPPYYTLLVRSLSVLEGIALASDPNYKVLAAAYPWVARRLLTERSPELQATLTALLYKDGRFDFERMESLIVQAVKPVGCRRLTPRPAGTTAAGASASASEPPRGDALALLLSPDGEFVRGIVAEELAKGIDAAWRVAADDAVDTAREQVMGVLMAEGAGGPAAFVTPPFSGALARTLLESLSAAPRLAETGDREQLDGMLRLGRALQESSTPQQQPSGSWFTEPPKPGSGGSAQQGSTGGPGGGWPGCSPSGNPLEAALSTLDSTASMLRWIASEAEALTPQEREEALRLPAVVGQGVASRVTARVVRWLAAAEGSQTAAAEEQAALWQARQRQQRRAARRAQAAGAGRPAGGAAGATSTASAAGGAAAGAAASAVPPPSAAAPRPAASGSGSSGKAAAPAQGAGAGAGASVNGKAGARTGPGTSSTGSSGTSSTRRAEPAMRPLSTTASASSITKGQS